MCNTNCLLNEQKTPQKNESFIKLVQLYKMPVFYTLNKIVLFRSDNFKSKVSGFRKELQFIK